ncbi:helix-turn-helix domain-containing protein [Polynucleobacter antarcticus]|uniref:Transcriptional regulator n=1 Tax=Polynucleobacter antarcticus TaxID=1743162 RepID=A0A6M9PR21_9BURK|nr:transcriptional regulator [Polynucleobacter antarcticus]QKM61938.1 transcriptional regulator [Polynucleobacter antarcticus]
MRKKLLTEENRVLDELLEIAMDLDQHGLLTKHDLVKMKALCIEKPPVFTSKKVADLRIHQAKMSQSIFAALLNVSVSTVQKWEATGSGKHPSGAAAKLLQIIEMKGIQAILL